MKPKSLIVLALITLVVVFAAIESLREPQTANADSSANSALFLDGLMDRINQVVRIEVRSGGEELVAVNREGEWLLETEGGYPAKFEIVKATLVGLAGLKRAEGKTSNPKSYSILGVDAPGPEANSSTQVTLLDSSGSTLAAIILGNRKGNRTPQLFVRAPDARQAWLVDGRVNVELEPGFWMEKQFANITQDRIASVQIERTDGAGLFVSKDRPTDPNFAVANLPNDRELISDSIANAIASGLNFLSLEKVRPATEVDFETAKVAQATYRTWDGLVVTVETTLFEGEGWIHLTASSNVPPTILPEPTAEGEEPAEPAAFEGASAEEIAIEVLEFNQAVGTWAYKVPTYKLSSFEKRMEELLREPAAPEAASEQATPAFDPFSLGDSTEDDSSDKVPASFEDLMNASEEKLDQVEKSDD